MFESLKTALFSPVLIALLFGVLALSFANRGGDKLFGIKRFMGQVLGGIANFWRPIIFAVPIVSSVARRFVDKHDGAWVQRFMDKRFSASNDPMLRGRPSDRLAYAANMTPEEDYPSLWVSNVPEDLRRSVVADGRVITGAPLAQLAEASVTMAHQDLAAKAGATAFVVWFSLMLVIWHPGLIMASLSSSALSSVSADVAKVANDDALLARTLDKDHWSQAEYKSALVERKTQLNTPRSSEITPLTVLMDLLACLFAATAIGLLMAFSTFRGVFRSVLAALGRTVHDGTKEQVVRWKHRYEQRAMEYKAYCEQLNVAMKFDRSPLLDLGKSTGIYRFRGRLDSPYAGQRMKLSLIDTKQNALIIGGTGQGKTRTVIKPLLNQILQIRQVMRDRAVELRLRSLAVEHPDWTEARIADEAAKLPMSQSVSTRAAGEFVWPWGIKPTFEHYVQMTYPLDISTYVTDVKAVLYHDLRDIAAARGLLNDLLVIGTNEANGESSVDLLDGVAPQLVSDMIRSVARQSGGGQSGDEIWPDMAADVIRNCAVVARAFDATDEGVEWVRKHRGERPYSLVFIYELALDGGALLTTILDALAKAEEDPNLYPRIKAFHTSELDDACRFLSESWLPMVQQTKDGIRINIINILGAFGSNPTLRASFAGGAGKRQVSADQFWGRLCVTNVSSLDFGVAGRIINVFLKILFMTEAAKREKQTKAERAALEYRFFEMFPRLSEVDCSIDELEQSKANYTATQLAAFTAMKDAAERANESLKNILVACGIQVPAPEKFIEQDLVVREKALSTITVDKRPLAEPVFVDLDAYREAKAAFAKRHRSLARKRVFLSDAKAIDPYRIEESMRAREDDILQDIADHSRAAGIDNTIRTIDDAVRTAHEIYQMWRVVNTRLDGFGDGAIREQMFFVADEYQALITADTKEGAMSDSNFPNISRSTAVSMMVATQGLAALKQAIGADAMDNFCQQMRTKIFLQVEDTTTFEYIKKLSGKSLRSYVFDNKGFESYDAMVQMEGLSDVGLNGVQIIDIMDNNPGSSEALSAGAEMALTPSARVSANDAVHKHDKTLHVDASFVPRLRQNRHRGGGIDTNADQILGAQQQARWRAEDLQHKSLSEGNQDMDVFREDDFTLMSRNHAYMFVQRAGKSRQDYVQLDLAGNIEM
jgi:hypothetical protein